ncbi:MAG TPA: hypothetical protein VL088_05345 [Pedobacter sp.]|nr:hypothetical protein [Pedobacter sp.]
MKESKIGGLKQISFLLILGFIFLFPSITPAQTVFENSLKAKMDSIVTQKGDYKFFNQALLPNNSVQSIMTPSGWGGGNSTYIFGVIGGVFPAMYTDPQKGDLIGVVGVSGGNPVKYVNASVSLNVTRVSELRDLSANIILSRQIFKGSSISVGGLQLFASPSVSDAPDPTFYVAYSHAAQSVRSRTAGYSGLGYTIGYGTGRFLHKSPQDTLNGKGKFGTGFFANISYEIVRQVNLNAEWSGMNLGFSSGVRPFKGSPLTVGFGVYNLTKYSGDRIQFIASMGLPIVLGRGVENRRQKMDRLKNDKNSIRDDRTPPNFRGGENGLIMRN